jgi:hypothetical protein
MVNSVDVVIKRPLVLLSLWSVARIIEANSLRAKSAPTDTPDDRHASYGIDVSWPIHHGNVSFNFPWLPHNLDPEHHPIPLEYIGMPLQPMGDRQQRYNGKTFLLCVAYIIIF